MNLLILFPLFFLAAFFSFYIPGALTLSYIFPVLSKEKRFIASWTIGVAFFLLLAYLFAWIHVDFLLLIILAGAAIFSIWKRREIFYFPRITDWLTLSVVLFGALAFLGVTFFSGFKTGQGLQFIGVINISDGLLHIANIKNLLIHFPPTHSALAGISLRGYHYFYDLLASRFVLFYHFSPLDLHYRFFALFIALLYGANMYLFVSSLTNKKASIRFALFFGFFAQSSATILSLFIPNLAPHSELGLVYPIELITNPAILLSVSMLLAGMYLLVNIKTIRQGIVLGVLLGVISETKVYTGIIGLGALVVYFFYVGIKHKKMSLPLVATLIVAIVLTGITFFPNNAGSGNLWYSPFFVYSVFMQEPPVNVLNWELRRRIFADHHNILHLAVLYAQAVGIFWLLALGSRAIFLLGLVSIFKKKFWQKDAHILLICAIGIPIVIGSLFVQSVSIFDTKQFFWIAAALLGIPSGLVLGNIWTKIPKVFGIIAVCIVIFMSWGGFVYHMRMFVFQPSTFVISNQQLHVFDSVSNLTDKESFVVVANDVDKIYNGEDARALYAAPLISAITGIPVYYEHEPAQYKLDAVYLQRKTMITKIEDALKACNTHLVQTALQEIGSKYLLTFPPYPCVDESGILEKKYISNNFAFYILK